MEVSTSFEDIERFRDLSCQYFRLLLQLLLQDVFGQIVRQSQAVLLPLSDSN
jgi:hypothetical protein